MASSDHYSQQLTAQLRDAASHGLKHVVINAHELYRSIDGFRPAADKMVSCRLAMRIEMKDGDVLLVAEKNAAGMSVRYLLPRMAY